MDVKEYNECLSKVYIGEKSGLKSIYDANIIPLYDYLYEIFKNKDTVNDILAAFFLDIWNNTDNYKNTDNDILNFLLNKLTAFMEENYD